MIKIKKNEINFIILVLCAICAFIVLVILIVIDFKFDNDVIIWAFAGHGIGNFFVVHVYNTLKYDY